MKCITCGKDMYLDEIESLWFHKDMSAGCQGVPYGIDLAQPLSDLVFANERTPAIPAYDAWNKPVATQPKSQPGGFSDLTAHEAHDPSTPRDPDHIDNVVLGKAWDTVVTETSGGVKFDSGKPRFGLLPYESLKQVAEVMTLGASKYSDWNWAKGMSWIRLVDAAQRHLTAWSAGKNKDTETGLSHLAHAACCIMFLLFYEAWPKRYRSFDDRRPDYVPRMENE